MKRKPYSQFQINPSHIKILKTVETLNSKGKGVSHEGIVKVLHGILDNETKLIKDEEVFSTLVSSSPKRIAALEKNLLRRNLLKLFYDEKIDDYFYLITPLGRNALENKSLRKTTYKKTEIKSKITIVDIPKN